MSLLTQDELLTRLGQAVHRNLPGVGKTTADGLQSFLATLVREMVARSAASASAGAVLTAPNGLRYRLAVGNDGQVSTMAADGLPPADKAAVLTAPNGLTYRLTVSNDGRLSALLAPTATDPDAAAFIAAAGLVNVAQQVAVQNLVRALKISNVWPRLHALYPMVGGTGAAHALNLKDPRDADAAFRLTFFQNPRHSELGVSWDGSSQYADTHFVPAGRLALDSSHLAYYATTTAPLRAQSEMEIGCSANSRSFSLSCCSSNSTLDFGMPGGAIYGRVPTPLGFSIGNRRDLATANVYRDGQSRSEGGGSPPGQPHPDAPLLLAYRQDGYRSTRTCGLASVGDGLSDDEVRAYTAAVQAFQRTLGRDMAYEPEALAFGRAAGLGAGHTQAVNALVRSLKDGGVWPLLRAVYPMVGGTGVAHALNLKDPRDADTAFRLLFINNPAHTAQGVVWNGRDQEAYTFLVPSEHLDSADHHLAYYAVTDSGNGAQFEMGTDDGDGELSLSVRCHDFGYVTVFNSCATYQRSAPVAHGLGFTLNVRQDRTTTALYRDGQALPLQVATNGNTNHPNSPIRLGARSDGYHTEKTCGFASIGRGLSPTQAVAYSAAVRTFQQALGRDVSVAPELLLA